MSLREKIRGLKIVLFLENIFFFFYRYSLDLCAKKINDWGEGKGLWKRILYIIFLPYIIVRGIVLFILEQTIFRFITNKKILNDQKKEYKYDLSIAAIAKNESNYLREWVAYYRVICDDKVHFYIYDNDSTDNMRETISDYIEEGFITYTPIHGTKMQQVAYNDIIKKYKDESRFIAFLDIDEFIVLKNQSNLTEYVKEKINKYKNTVGIGINWNIFGSSGYKEKREGLVTETFLRHGSKEHWGNTHVKTICNPRFVKDYISPHYPEYKLGCWNIAPNGERQNLWWNKEVDWNEIAINHYFCKSEEEYFIKRNRGLAYLKNAKYDDKRFIQYDLNDYYDDTMLKYSDSMKKIMKEK